MRIFLLIFLLPLCLNAQKNSYAYDNLIGAGITLVSSIVLYEATDVAIPSVALGFVLGASSRHVKEKIDVKRGYVYEEQKVYATVWGSVTAVIMFIPYWDIKRKKLDKEWDKLNKFNFKTDTLK
jgi:hypothetical protein